MKHDRKKEKQSLDEPEDEPQPKRKMKEAEILRRYPVGIRSGLDDCSSIEQHKKALTNELAKSKPRDSVLLPLMKSTYNERRMYILNEAISVGNILEKYPALSRIAVVMLYLCVQLS